MHEHRRLASIAIGLVVTGLLAGLLVGDGIVGRAFAAEPTGRFGGPDRYDTAAEIARAAFPDGAATALLARGDLFPDAVAGSALAGTVDGPILLTRPAALPGATLAVLDELGVGRVLILGSPGAIGSGVEAELRGRGFDVDRIAGTDRYRTAAEIARAIGGGSIGAIEGRRTVFVATGERFPDALSAGWAAYAGIHPILLTRQSALPESTRDALVELAPDEAVLVGSSAVVGTGVAEAIEALGIATRRVAGRDRMDTSTALADFYHHAANITVDDVVLARGDLFPDALAVASYAGIHRAPILLTRTPTSVSHDVLQWVVDHSETIEAVYAAGSPFAVSDAVLADVAEAAEPPATEYTYEVGSTGSVASDLAFFAEHADWTLTDGRGWSLDYEIRFTRVDSGADFRLWLASPAAVEAAAPYCSATWSCRVGDDVYINDDRWRTATATYADRPLDDYRHYVVLHEVGHWLGLGHFSCPGAGQPAPVMQQQSISLDGCVSNVWPLSWERELVRERHLGAAGATDDGEME